MNDWQRVFEEWFPKEINKLYPIKISKQYTSSQRWEIYEKLTKKQRQLVDRHRRYLINSQFIEENYLAATDWFFSDFKINPFFRTKRRQQKLYCDCGRELKVQYIVQSPTTGKKLHLGINHFAEHLHVSPKIATSINEGMTKVDLALDELLWLKQQNIDFPEKLWQEYCFMLYQNRKLKDPYFPDEKLTKRVVEFREASMPIYVADYQALISEIHCIEQKLKGQTKTIRGKKELFEDFSEELIKDVETFLNNYHIYLRKDWSAIGIEGGEQPSFAFFETFIQILRATKRQQNEEQRLKMEQYAQSQRFIQVKVCLFIWQQYCRYGFTEGFFDSIPRVIRNGFLKSLRKERQANKKIEKHQKVVTDDLWEQIAIDLKNQKVSNIIEELSANHYSLTKEQQYALLYFQQLEHFLQNEKPETKELLKRLL
ncbi:hypothetical protein [Enterococcus villorum]|uniref:Uncharacterized protein n=2 Tax=Enterococcus villorum TaxID=112904 RepID=A0A511J0V4_9ENTE|nr:hypothetical protein [Enterococcus villorum]EOH88942.1 hypothetical protein UAO_01674 [Enterococcus villorum ATCC 700913]EOW76209.1 hypothetical protein I591_01511 [Enterococcus villorum ATCC 700913]GEL91263.1 hypothetical protein EVI01_06000 [Enterococcus villorum]